MENIKWSLEFDKESVNGPSNSVERRILHQPVGQ